VHGYVGNKSAVFPLQLLGFDVCPVNSVQFSNHTGYEGGWEGTVLQGGELEKLVEGLGRNGLLEGFARVLSGYIGSASFLEAVANVVRAAPGVRYVCDPVLGDNGRLYVPDTLPALYREKLLPLCYMATPNSFEAALLTGLPVTSLPEAAAACEALHALGPEVVVITSLDFPGAAGLTVLASERGGGKWAVDCRRLPGHYTGTGDLCAALLLAWDALVPEGGEGRLGEVLGRVVNTMYRVIERTCEACGGETADAGGRELRLVQSKRDIEAGGEGGKEKFVPYPYVSE
jgi:pyridoxine kinase